MANEEEQDSKEYSRPDATKAFEIYDRYIAPNLAKISELSGDNSPHWKDIKKYAHYPRPVMNFLISLNNIDDDAKRDHHLLALSAGLKHLGLFLPRDLVSMAQGEDGDDIVPTGERDDDDLVTLHDEDEDDFDDAPQPGTGAAAAAAMKKAAREGATALN